MGAAGTTLLLTLAFVLIAAGSAKVRDAMRGAPVETRTLALGLTEIAIAAVAILCQAAVGGSLLAVTFLVFTGVHVQSWRNWQLGCDCLGVGRAEGVSPRRAAAITAGSAVAAATVAFFGAPSAAGLAADHGGELVLAILASLLGGGLWLAAFTLTPQPGAPVSETVVRASAHFVERRFSRRTILQDAAIVGSALVVAPLRYMLYPGTAIAAILRTPSDCTSGLCLDGFTEFCCEITGGRNTCPENTFPGGWWMCTDYAGRELCAEEGVRYYVDCNALPGRPFPGGCRCGQNNCNHRRVACNIFRYGQCNTQIEGVTAVVCRMVICENPALVAGLHCSSSLAVDDEVCAQDAPCLEPAAVQLAGAGGA